MKFRSVFAAALLVVGCGSPPTKTPVPGMVDVSGCEGWSGAATCVFASEGAKLKIWVDSRLDLAEVELDHRPVTGLREAGKGQLFEIDAKPESRLLVLRSKDGSRLELKLARSERPSWYQEASQLFTSGERDKAQDLLAAQRDFPTYKVYLEARFAGWEGDLQKALDLGKRSAELWLAADKPKQAVNDFVFAARVLADQARYDESREVLQRAQQVAAALELQPIQPTESFVLVSQMKAALAFMTGDIRNVLVETEALGSLRENQMVADADLSDLGQLEALTLAEVGRFEAAARRLDELEGLNLEADRKAELDLNRGWVALLERQTGRPGLDPRPFFERAWAFNGPDGQKLNTKINLARLAVLEGKASEARAHLRDAAALRERGGAREKFDFAEVEARLLLLEKEPQAALDHFQELEIATREHPLPRARWQALVGVAEALATLGRRPDAIAAFEEARRLEGRELLLIPVDRGRETFLARREQVTRRHLELLLEEGRPLEAFELLRRYRTQTLTLLQRDEEVATLDPERRRQWEHFVAEYRQRLLEIEKALENPTPSPSGQGSRKEGRQADSQEPATGLAALLDSALASLGLGEVPAKTTNPRPGELQLAFFPRQHSWLMFTMDDQGVLEVHETAVQPATPLSTVAPALLSLASKKIHTARKLRILPWGELDVHAVTFEGQPLLATKKIAYGVDVRSGPEQDRGGPRNVLLVGLQTRNMLRTGVEIQHAREIFQNKPGFRAPEFLYGLRAKAPTVREALKEADFFHFAGHGFFDPFGSQSRLSLAGGELRAADVLILPRVPSQVLLSTCSAGQANRASGVEGLGLAYAFVLKGSRQVLAATREVDDQQSAELARALYEHIAASNGEIDLAEALQQAQLRWLALRPNDDAWKAFRVFEP